MSKFSVGIILFLLLTKAGVSQLLNVYTKAGVLYGAPIGPTQEGDKGFLRMGPSFGFGCSYSLHTNLSFQLEVLLSNKKGGYDAVAEGDTTYAFEIPGQPPALFPTTYKGRVMGDFDNAYLEFPLTLSFRLGNSSLEIGGYYALLMSGSHTGKTDLVIGNNFTTIKERFNDSRYLKPYDVGITFGGSYYLVKNEISIGFSGSYGLTSIFLSNYPNVEGRFSNLYMYPYIRMNMF